MLTIEQLLNDITIAKSGDIKLPSEANGACGLYVLYLKKADIYYIGSTNNLWVRYVAHKNTLQKNDHANRLFQREYNRHGGEVIISFIITNTLEEARSLEQSLLDKYFKSDLLANLWSKVGVKPDGKAGGMAGKKHSEETKEILRQKTLEQFSSPEARQRHSEITKEKLKNPELLARIKNAQRVGCAAYRQNNDLSAKQKALWNKPGAKEKHRTACSGRFIRVRINGVEYDSVNAAARALGMSNFGIRYRIESPKHSAYEYVQSK